jgi:hypothetical protein
MTKKASTEMENTSTTFIPFAAGDLLIKQTHASDPQLETWLTTASDDALIVLWDARYGSGWTLTYANVVSLNWREMDDEERFKYSLTNQMILRGLVDKHHHMAEQATLYKLKCKS